MKIYYTIWSLLLLGSIGGVIMTTGIDAETEKVLLKEGGLIETASWIAYLVAAGLLLIQMLIRMPGRWSMLVLTLCLAARELDFDKRFTTMGIFKTRFYSSAEVPIAEKLLGVAITAALLVTLFFLIKKHFMPFLRQLRERRGPSLSFLFAGALMVFTKSIDGLSRKLEPFGIEPTEAVNKLAGHIEEIFELAASILVVVAVTGAFGQRSK
jgi:hypothetical protein